ncbi:MAG: chemotaxis protein CheW [Pseudomonadota bacterium]
MTATRLKALAQRPFELLQEMERRSRAAIAGQGSAGAQRNEWVGVGFSLAGERFVASRDEVREVMMVPDTITRVPGAKRWLVGIANLRGQLLPLIDLSQLLGGGRTDRGRTSRVISVNHREVHAGLLVEEVSGFRRFIDGEYSEDDTPTTIRCDRYRSGSFHRGGDVWPVFAFDKLLESEQFLQAADQPSRQGIMEEHT